MRLRTIAAVLAVAVATAAPLPLLACPMPRATTEKCTPAPHCEQMPMEHAALKACVDVSCCQLSTRPAESPATLKQVNAPEFEFSGVAFAQNVALPAAPAQELAPDSPLKVLPLERQALLCVFLI